jgi:hypothetical protein
MAGATRLEDGMLNDRRIVTLVDLLPDPYEGHPEGGQCGVCGEDQVNMAELAAEFLADLPPIDDLSDARAAAESALPEGWAIVQLSRLEPDFIGLNDDWEAVAIHPDYLALRSEFGHGPTMAAALLDLRSILMKRTEP